MPNSWTPMTTRRKQPDDSVRVASDAPDVDERDERQPPADAQASDIEELRRTLEEEAEQRYLRLLAEFDNYRRRTTREHSQASDAGRRAALMPLLAVLDTLEHALAAGSSDDSFYQGIVATRRLFADALREAGAERLDTVGEPFDPAVHEAVETVSDDDAGPGTIVRETRSGWRLGDQLLRPAQVVVTRTR
jgi:molecular chaperone GrpE